MKYFYLQNEILKILNQDSNNNYNAIELAFKTGVTSQSIRNAIRILRKRGLVDYIPKRRYFEYFITPKGKKVMEGFRRISGSMIMFKIKAMRMFFGEGFKGVIKEVKK